MLFRAGMTSAQLESAYARNLASLLVKSVCDAKKRFVTTLTIELNLPICFHVTFKFLQEFVTIKSCSIIVYDNTLKTWQEALSEPFGASWLSEMTREHYDLGTNRQCWKIINRTDVPAGATLIDSVWDFKCKFRNGVLEKVRARICGKGYQQKKGVDYFASFSPTASQVSIRLVYSCTALPGWRTVDLDASVDIRLKHSTEDSSIQMFTSGSIVCNKL